ncbi:hypothetical protein [Domibacillus tundrae]|uniref:hypothetical protein n=1 Tax=Domibacillus tundrae TaxID=1587527 RepID=UPI000617D62D|nr:hypothetical protein [Domibacillus tundrae]
MSSIEKARQRLDSLEDCSSFEKMIETTALLTELLEPYRIQPTVVGGLAVEIYTRSDYTTVDIDVIISDRKTAGNILEQLGFLVNGKHWYHPRLLISIEIPNDILEDADLERVIKMNIGEGKNIYVIGIEDIILDRMRACVHWKSTSDCEWGRRMFLLHFDHLDLKYMQETATTDGTLSLLENWLNTFT